MFQFFEGKIGEFFAPVMPMNQLFLAIQHHKNSEFQQLALSGQPDYDIRRLSDLGYAAIHVACRYNNLYVVDFLTQQGVSYEFLDSQGNTPLHYAAKYGHADLCKYLVEHGSSAARKNAQGRTPYDQSESHTVRQYLLPIQLQAEAASQEGVPQLHPGISYGSLGTMPVAYQHPIASPASYLPTPVALAPSTIPLPQVGAIMTQTSLHHTLPEQPVHIQQQQQPFAGPPAAPLANNSILPNSPAHLSHVPAQPTTNTGSTISRPVAPAAGPSGSLGTNPRVIRPDGFHSSASDPALQAKYGHVKAQINIAPPPTAASMMGATGAPPPQYSMFPPPNHPAGPGLAAGGPPNPYAAPPAYNRYVSYDAHTNTTANLSAPYPQPVYNSTGGATMMAPPPAHLSTAAYNPGSGQSQPLPGPPGTAVPRPVNVFNPATDCDVVDASKSSSSVM